MTHTPRYRCRDCDTEFTKPHPGPWDCPECGRLYLDWINYESRDWLGDGQAGPIKEASRGKPDKRLR